jgi:hypothetical protein
MKRMERLASEAKRPESKRLPLDSTPPRGILRAATKLGFLEPPPKGLSTGEKADLHVCRVMMDNDLLNVVLGFSLTVSTAWAPSSQQQGKPTSETKHVADIPWSPLMGSWSPEEWAWLLMALLNRTMWPIKRIALQFKLQDLPHDNFVRMVEESFSDILYTERYSGSMESYKGLMFVDDGNRDLTRLNDVAYLFDTKLWETALDIGFDLEDRSLRPGLTFYVGGRDNSRGIVLDKDGKRWNTQEGYIRGRLKKATLHESLSAKDASMHADFLWGMLKAQKMYNEEKTLKVGSKTEEGFLNGAVGWEMYNDFVEKKLGKRLRKLARKHNMEIPEAATKRSTRKCSNCGVAEGTARDVTGKVGCKLGNCVCNPEGPPYYCNVQCQRADWPDHKEFCTAATRSSTSPDHNNQEGGTNQRAKNKGNKKGKKKKKKKG